MTNVLPRSSAKRGSTKRLKGIAMLPVDGVNLREPLGPDKARLAAIERDADRWLARVLAAAADSFNARLEDPLGHEGGPATAAGPTIRNLERETR
jgi:hypothetical protein